MARWGWIPLAAGLATAAAAEAAVPGLDVRLKWPNDVRVAGRKLAGILCEARAESGDGFVVIGIGLNVNQSAFDGVHGAPTSLRLEAGRTVPRGDALSRLCDHAEVDVTTGISAPETSRKRYLERLEGVGEPVTVSGPDGVPRGSGVLAGVGALGELMLHTAEGPRTFASGDVTLRPFTL